MAEATLKNLLDVIAELDAKVDAHRSETKADAAKASARLVDVHREIEKDIEGAWPARTAARAPQAR